MTDRRALQLRPGCSEIGRGELEQLDETIAYYEQKPDEASQHEVRRLRGIRRGMLDPRGVAIVTAACPSTAA